MYVLKPEKKLAVIATLVEGNSIRSTERLTGVHRDTIMRLLVRTGERCQTILAETMRDLRCRSVQVDELWTYVQKKQARLSFEDRLRLDVGDQYAFVAIDAETKLIPHFDVGKRNMVTAYRFMETLKARLAESPERVKHFETPAHRIYCRASTVSVVGPGALIHTAAGRAGGVGGWRTKRSGWTAYAAVSTAWRLVRTGPASSSWTTPGVSSPSPA